MLNYKTPPIKIHHLAFIIPMLFCIFATMMHLNSNSEWFAEWFNSPYYHILYKNRDDEEARAFIERLCNFLKLTAHSSVLDLACGAGRHSRVLHQLGYKVSGCDLSPNSISEAKANSSSEIDFYVHDMRLTLPKKYDAILNLFTSIGYFKELEDNLQVFESVSKGLNEHGVFVIDFMNCNKIVREMKPRYVITIDDITFNIKKEISHGKILKSITFQDKGESYFFQEKVQILTYEIFEELLTKAGFKIKNTFGSYQLDEFNPEQSDRLILVCTNE